VLQLFHLSAEYIDADVARRAALVDYAERFILRRFAGSVLLAQHQAERGRRRGADGSLASRHLVKRVGVGKKQAP
jgi:hypothetical protein